MKATGIVRRIDDLGRIVIPREIRHNMNIKENDPVEFFTEKGYLILQPYMGWMNRRNDYAQVMCDTLIKLAKTEDMNVDCKIFDIDGIRINGLSVSNTSHKSAKVKAFIDSKDDFLLNRGAMMLLISASFGPSNTDMSIVIQLTYDDDYVDVNKLKLMAKTIAASYQNFLNTFC